MELLATDTTVRAETFTFGLVKAEEPLETVETLKLMVVRVKELVKVVMLKFVVVTHKIQKVDL